MNEIKIKCTNCGRTFDVSDQNTQCPYCGIMNKMPKPPKVSKTPIEKKVSKNSSRKGSSLVPILVAVFFTVVICINVIPRFMGGTKSQENQNSVQQPVNQVEAQSQETMKPVQETAAPETTVPETEASRLIQLDNIGYDTMKYPSSSSDFVTVTDPDGVYSFMYPKKFFKSGYYDTDTKTFILEAADGITALKITQEEAVIPNSPRESSNKRLDQYLGSFVAGDETPYTFASKAVAESGYSRSIIAGKLKDGRGCYICTASNSAKTYTLSVTYKAGDTKGTTVEKSPRGYLLDCIYRGWSISGSTYELRSYEQYMNSEMGTKKP